MPHASLVLALLSSVAAPARTAPDELRLAAILGDHMVLQRESAIVVHGVAAPASEVRVAASWSDRAWSARADSHGEFAVELTTPAAGGPHRVVVRDGTAERALEDVWIGEVWIASGQSNMEWPLARVDGGAEAIAQADRPRIRCFTVENTVAAEPASDVRGTWTVASPDSAGAFSAVAYLFACELERELDVPIGVIDSTWGGTPAEAWTSLVGLEPLGISASAATPIEPSTPSALWNAMIAPLARTTLRGVVWYQGESNVGRGEQYARLFPALIADWRHTFGRDLPFYYVQIAPFRYGGDPDAAGELRDAQRRALATPGTGMVVTLDIGDPEDIHPGEKREVARRLARLALARTYGRSDVVDSGPLYRAHSIEGGAVRIELDHARGLVARGGAPTHFEIAGADGRWVAAEARIDGETIVVSSPDVPAPTSVRYAWSAAAEPNVFNGAGFPASTFRTEPARAR